MLREQWNIKPASNTHKYTRYALGNDGSITPVQAKDRYDRVEKNKLLKFDAWWYLDDSTIYIIDNQLNRVSSKCHQKVIKKIADDKRKRLIYNESLTLR